MYRPSAAALPLGVALLTLAFSGASGLEAQTPTQAEIRREIQESQRRLEEIREERARLQAEMRGLRSRMQDASTELRNIEQQLSASRSVLGEIEFQLDATGNRVDEITTELTRTRQELSGRQHLLRDRLRSIYVRGPLHTVRVLLGADSFTDLLNRYRYLQLVASYDRSLLTSVQEMEAALQAQAREMTESLSELDRLRQEQVREVAQLREVEADRQRALDQFRGQEAQTATRVEELEAQEGRMAGLVGDLERRRLETERRAAGAGSTPMATTLSLADMGALAWPVEGELAYRFGLDQRPNGTVLRWNGVGIRAPLGEPVRAVRDGTVVLAGPFEGYGPTVIVSHGDGFYTLYLYLEEIGVVEGRSVTTGQVVGTVGGGSTADGPHMEFQLRAPVGGAGPRAQDPLEWLRPRGDDS